MALDGCGLFCKYILILFNVVFTLLGFVFLGLGLWLRFSESTRGFFELQGSSAFVMAVIVLIALGSVMLIVVAFGDHGACNEKRCPLQVFSILLGFLAVAEIAVGVLAYANRTVVGQNIAEFYASMYLLYATSGDPIVGATLAFIHKTLHCCGATGVKMFEVVQNTCPKPDGFLGLVMPACPGIIVNVFDSKASMVLGIFLGTGALLIIALICSMTLSRQLRQSASSPQYIILTQPTNPQPSPHQHVFASTSYPQLDQEPVVFTPLTVANIPAAQA
ncbi:CD9 antigen [Collichthys lucidus]|uniref:Tetraspanin n=1 Tax=Collichthys lucidus TaxID=240159 RepID=A0A4V6ATA6_COLLU|nr:CD9 antigen [Collichthys lucidus]